MEAGDGTSYIAGMREAALHATAGRCPNIVSLLDAFEHRSSSGRHPVMVLERCGANLLVVSGLGRFLERGLDTRLSLHSNRLAPIVTVTQMYKCEGVRAQSVVFLGLCAGGAWW